MRNLIKDEAAAQQPLADSENRSWLQGLAGFLRFLLPVAVLAVGAAATVWLLQTGPQAKSRPPVPNALLVEVTPIVFAPGRTVVEAMGTVMAARQVELRPRVSGEVVEMTPNLVPGGLFRAGDILLKLDPADYRLMVRQLEGEVAQAESELKLEQGNQDIARREFEILGEVVQEEDLGLVLRQPQLESVRARLETAKARLAQARLDLERTTVQVPFNAVVQSRNVELGARVSETTVLATMVGTDAFWVELAVPVQQLAWLRIPRNGEGDGSTVRLHDPAWGPEVYRTGQVVRLTAGLEEQGRMARLLVKVDDPLNLRPENARRPKMFIGSYVRAELEGSELATVAKLDRRLLHDGDRVWIMDDENRLEVRPVEVAFRGRETVLIASGLQPGERLVVTDLAAPVPGTQLRTAQMPVAPPTGAGENKP